MRGTATKRLRTDTRPHQGRKHGGSTKAVATHQADRRSSNKFRGTTPPERIHRSWLDRLIDFLQTRVRR